MYLLLCSEEKLPYKNKNKANNLHENDALYLSFELFSMFDVFRNVPGIGDTCHTLPGHQSGRGPWPFWSFSSGMSSSNWAVGLYLYFIFI